MSGPPTARDPVARLAELERDNAKLRKINRVLMERVERSMDFQGNAYSLFQTAIVLESKVRERTLALETALADLREANQTAEAARREAERANLSKTRFLAAASHDLLQPLNAARVFASALAERRLAPANGGLVRRTLAALDSVDEILTALLDISKLDAGVQTVTVGEFRIADLLAVLADEFAMMAGHKGVRLRFVPCSAVIRSDPALLGRILRNYITNAIRYGATGGRIVVGCRRHGGSLLIGVWDTGPGIPGDKLDEIFEEFRRLQQSGEKTERGMGLGLAIVRRIARMLDHPLVVRSHLGHGSLFGVDVPLARGRAKPLPRRAAPAPATAASLDGAKLVVIENDAEILAGMCALLEQWGCRTWAAASAAAAAAAMAAAGETPDLVLADYHLNDDEVGVDAITLLRTRLEREVPAVVITADYSDAVRAAVDASGCHILNKPLRKAKLRSLLVHLLSRKDVP